MIDNIFFSSTASITSSSSPQIKKYRKSEKTPIRSSRRKQNQMVEEVCEGKDFSFPSQEKHILSYWSQIGTFRGHLARTHNLPEYIF